MLAVFYFFFMGHAAKALLPPRLHLKKKKCFDPGSVWEKFAVFEMDK
jgi:hypothetical protein